MSTRLIVCESYPAYVIHLRVLKDGDEPQYTGYKRLEVVALCGRVMKGGWDTKQPLPKSREHWSNQPGSSGACKHCFEKYSVIKSESQTT